MFVQPTALCPVLRAIRMSETKRMPYGAWVYTDSVFSLRCSTHSRILVRLGSSGLKVSKIILGTMQYGHPGWRGWFMDEETALEHIKYACVFIH